MPIPAHYPIFNRVKEKFDKSGIDTLAVIDKNVHLDNDPPVDVPYERWVKTRKKTRRLTKQ